MTDRAGAIWRRSRRFYMQDDGQLTIEWTLVLAAIALPMYFVFKVCMSLMAAHFRMVSFMETVPFP